MSMTFMAANAADSDNFKAKTTHDLVALCSVAVGDDLYDAAMGYCLGFVDAAHDYHMAVTAGDLMKPIACPDHTTTRQEVVDMFLEWAKGSESLLDQESPINGLMRAASEKWPCED